MVIADNLSVICRADAIALRQALNQLVAEGRPSRADALRLVAGLARGQLSKFQPCLTPRLEAEYLAEVLVDEGGARAAVKEAATVM